jgi:hypothetical protein
LPETGSFDVKALGADLASATDVAPSARRLLRAAIAENLCNDGRIILVAEHELVADHYLGVARILRDAAHAYRARFTSREQRRVDQNTRRRAWEVRKAAVDAYESRGLLHKLFNERPDGPEGPMPGIDAHLAHPTAWMDDLLEYPQQLDHIVLLDAGGLSLDIAVLEKSSLVAPLSRSDASCGGEAVSARIGRREEAQRGTRHKARLGTLWHDTRDLTDHAQREYHDASRALYSPVLTPLFDALGERWKDTQRCSVVLTGGGAKNPHYAELVSELAREAGLHVNVVDGPSLEYLLEQAREFSGPLPQLQSEVVRRFEKVQSWSNRREKVLTARYDMFAVVGGMLALEAGRRQQ